METIVLKSERNRAQRILAILREKLTIRQEDFASVQVAKESGDPFRVLVVTVLSQSCTDVAAMRAYRNLDREVGVTVQELKRAKVKDIGKAIRVAGLHRQKAKALRKLAEMVSKRYSDNLQTALEGSLEEVRSRLQELPKVGPKTADVLLGILGRPTISVDTHVDRVAERLGLAPKKAKYEEVRGSLLQLFSEEDYDSVPLLFMAHGRRYCKALRPLCPICPMLKLCPYRYKTKEIPVTNG